MRKVDRRKLQWLIRRDQRRRHRVSHRAKAYTTKAKQRDTLVAPSFFTIATKENERSAASKNFLDFLAALRSYKGENLCIDLSDVSRMVVSAALVFKAELCYLRSRGVHLSGRLSRKQRIQQVLTQTGICDLLGLPKASRVDREDTLHWRFASGVWTRAQPSRLQALLDPDLQMDASSLYTGMIESVANCIEHAYVPHPDRRHLSLDQEGWWGFQQLRDGFLSTCICDLGIGVAKALPIRLADEPGVLRKLMSLLAHAKGADNRAILAAIEYGRSSTREAQRGKGLRDAHRVIDDAGEGDFQLISNSGLYYYRREQGKPDAISGTRRLQGSISGTIYFWRYPVKSSTQSAPPSAQGASS